MLTIMQISHWTPTHRDASLAGAISGSEMRSTFVVYV